MKYLITTIAALVLAGCGESSKYSREVTGIWKSAEDGNIEAVKQYLADGADVNARNRHGDSPLGLAALMDHKKIVELLIAKGADVNAATDNGVTPLHTSAGLGHKEIVELLIAKDADVNSKDFFGRTSLDSAARKGRTEIADLLRKHGGKTGEELKAEGK